MKFAENIQNRVKPLLTIKVSYMDCLWGELYSAINSNQWSNAITQEQADYLRAKYL